MAPGTPINLMQYGLMAEKHWREFLPRMVSDLERQGKLQAMLLEAEEKTKDEMHEMHELTMDLIRRGLTAQQAHDRAWKMVRGRYILLPPETDRR